MPPFLSWRYLGIITDVRGRRKVKKEESSSSSFSGRCYLRRAISGLRRRTALWRHLLLRQQGCRFSSSQNKGSPVPSEIFPKDGLLKMQLWYRPIHFYEQIKNCWFLTFCTKKWERRGSGIVFSSSSFANERGKFWNSLFRPAYDPEKRIWNFGSTLFCPNYSSGKKVMKIISLSRKLRRSRKRRTWEIYGGETDFSRLVSLSSWTHVGCRKINVGRR